MNKAVRWINNFRFALFPIGYGLAGLMVNSTLNRIMTVELGYDIGIVGILVSLPLFISPLRMWFGYRSDGFPIFGKRREPYMVLGGIIFAAASIFIVKMALDGLPGSVASLSIIAIGFLIFGVGRLLGHTSYQALLTDKFQGQVRSRAAAFYEAATMVGTIMGAGLISVSLKPAKEIASTMSTEALGAYAVEQMGSVILVLAAIIFVFTLLAALGNEPKMEADVEGYSDKAKETSFPQVIREYVMGDAQVRAFFFIILLTFFGTFAQDVILEPFGGLVLGMPADETTALNQYWGVGILLAMVTSGAILLKSLGRLRLMRIGLIVSITSFMALIVVGMIQNVTVFNYVVFVMGLGTGLAGAGMLATVVNFTTQIRAGVLLGVWGFANMMGHALGQLIGSGVASIMMKLTGENAGISYSAVFVLEIIILGVAYWMTLRVNEDASKAFKEVKA